MTVYVAGSWHYREEIINITAWLRQEGVECTNHWMDREATTDQERAHCAETDLSEVEKADAVLLMNWFPSSSGGMHFETGWAYAKGKPIYVIGASTCVFHQLTGVTRLLSVFDFLQHAKRSALH